mgnify:CR=1 FL=1
MNFEDIHPLERSVLHKIHEMNRLEDRNPVVHLLLLEIARLHQVVRKVERCYQSMRTVWREDVGGEIVGMYQLRVMLQHEMNLYGLPVHPRDEEVKAKRWQDCDTKRFMANIKVLDDVRNNQTS